MLLLIFIHLVLFLKIDKQKMQITNFSCVYSSNSFLIVASVQKMFLSWCSEFKSEQRMSKLFACLSVCVEAGRTNGLLTTQAEIMDLHITVICPSCNKLETHACRMHTQCSEIKWFLIMIFIFDIVCLSR